MKISIFSFAVNDKFPINITHNQFKKYMNEEYEFIIFNDAMNIDMETKINEITSNNNIKCVRVPQDIHKINNPSEAYATTLDWAVREYAVNNDCEVIVLMHTDIFPICNISISNIIGDNIIASTTEFRILDGNPVNYLYPAFTVINMKLLKNPNDLSFGVEPGLDTGGKSRHFINNNAQLVKFLPVYQASYMMSIMEKDPVSKYFKDDLEICRNHGLSAGWVSCGFYHYMAGSQWNADNLTFAEGHKKRMDLFLKYFN